MQQETGTSAPRVDLTRRRITSRARAVIATLLGVVTLAATAMLLLFVAVFAIARAWTWFLGRQIDDFWLWGVAPGLAVGAGIVAVAVTAALLFRHFWTAAVDIALRDLDAERVGPGHGPGKFGQQRVDRLHAVLGQVTTGLGQEAPELWITDDTAPNSLSLRTSDRRAVVVTTAVLELPRSEQEAMMAHELAHLWATDAHWVTCGILALATARRVGTEIWAAGVATMAIIGVLAWKSQIYLWGTFATGLGLFIIGGVAKWTFGRLERQLRRESDELADVAAVQLARDPWSLGKLCLRLADDDRQVGPAPVRLEHLWFEMVHTSAVGDTDDLAPVRSRLDMYRRAERAYAEAREPLPDGARQRIDDFRAAHPGIT